MERGTSAVVLAAVAVLPLMVLFRMISRLVFPNMPRAPFTAAAPCGLTIVA